MTAEERIKKCGVVPVAAFDSADEAVKACESMLAGGVNVVEITFRTRAAADAIKAVSEAHPEMLVGAGTVLTAEQAEEAVRCGAQFIVSPGISSDVVEWCLTNEIPVYPGAVTPTEITEAVVRYGLKTVKYFPANLYGGIDGMKALAAPFGDIRFMPTGGVNADNLESYLKQPFILAVGGTWLCSGKAIHEGRFKDIEDACREACSIVQKVRDEQ